MNDNEVLECRVRGVNAAHKYAHELYARLTPIFKPFVGQKIERADGGLLLKIYQLVPDFPNTPQLSVYKHRSDYSLAWTVKTCETDSRHAHYYEVTVYVGEMRNGVLEKISPKFEARTDYTVAETLAARATYASAKKLASEAESKLWPFGEYDR